ncbi:hypothetical protein [Halosimplex salinum]|uniref:hypothetical protein n=1 Tax=Halosimplex salinum TaxID=1710538 RepID=UPI0013DE0170|nr:hypothetical protein [Halosimplex salinum]
MAPDESIEAAQQTLAEHLDDALEHATDETAVFHLRQAKQLTVDLPTVVDTKTHERAD